MMIERVIYKSRATVPIDLDVVLSITSESTPRNRKLNITGILLATNTHFFQVLEGEEKALSSVFRRIRKDPRHTDLELISQGPVPGREFSDWAMKGVGLMGLGDPLRDSLADRFGKENGELRFPMEESEALVLLREVLNHLQRENV